MLLTLLLDPKYFSDTYFVVLLSLLAAGVLSEVGVLAGVVKLKRRGVLNWGEAIIAWLIGSLLVFLLWQNQVHYLFK